MIRALGGAIAVCLILLAGVSKYAMSVNMENTELKTSNDMLATSLASAERRRIELDKLAMDRARINRKLQKDADAYNDYLKTLDNPDTQDLLNTPIPDGL